jgi:hypothetical protein
MPRLVREAERVVAHVWHREVEAARVLSEPAERGRRLELFRERTGSGRCDVDRSSRVVLAEAWRSIHLEDRFDVVSRRELSPNQIDLVGHAAKSGHDQELDAVSERRRLHLSPGARGFRRQPLHASHDIRLCVLELLRFGVARAAWITAVVNRNSEVGEEL